MNMQFTPRLTPVQSEPLSLSAIWDALPEEWREFTPSPHHGYVAKCRADLTKMGVIPLNDRIFPGLCGVPRYFHPQGDEETLILSLEFIAWYFYFDDRFDEGEIRPGSGGVEVIDRMLEVLATGDTRPDAHPTELLCQRFRQRSLRMAGDRIEPWRRFVEECEAWVWSIPTLHRQPTHPRQSTLLTLVDYTQLRKVNVGITPIYTLNEIIEDLRLEPEFLTREEILRFGELAALVIAYCNDIYSCEREIENSTQANSLEIRRQGTMTLADALAEQFDDIAEMLREMSNLERALTDLGILGVAPLEQDSKTSRARRTQTRYIECIKNLVVGNHLWSLSDGRYHSMSSPFRELRNTAV